MTTMTHEILTTLYAISYAALVKIKHPVHI